MKSRTKTIISIAIIAVLACAAVLPRALQPIDGHDSDFHVASVYSLATSERTNLFDVKIFDSKAGNFSYGEGIFYPQLTHVIAAYVFRIGQHIGIHLYRAIAITYFLLLFLAGLAAFCLLRKILKSHWLATLSSCVYMLSPYLLSDILIRDAMAEVGIFIFLPVICLSLYYMAQKKYLSFFILFIIGGVGLIYSHLVLTVFVVIFLLIYILANHRTYLTKENFLRFIAGSLMIVAISAPFWMPMLQHKVAGNYTVFMDGYMVNDRTISKAHIEASDLLIPTFKQRKIIYSFDAIVLIMSLVGIINIKHIRSDKRKLYILLFIGNVICCLLSIGIINITSWPKPLQMIQFAWRLLTLSCLFVAIMFGLSLESLSKKTAYFITALFVLFSAWDYTCLFNNISFSDGRKISSLSRITKRYNEYYPVNTYQKKDYFEGRPYSIAITDGDAEFTKYTGKVPNMDFGIKTQNGATIEIPRLFYYGYEIKAHYDDGSTELIEYHEDKYGFIEFSVEKDAHISVRYTGGAIYGIAKIISATALVLLLTNLIYILNARNLSASYATYLSFYKTNALKLPRRKKKH